jgi:hypothetical protein
MVSASTLLGPQAIAVPLGGAQRLELLLPSVAPRAFDEGP